MWMWGYLKRGGDLPPSPIRIPADRDVSDQPSLEKHPRPSWFRTQVLPLHGKFPVSSPGRIRYGDGGTPPQIGAFSHSLSREPLAKYFGVLVDEEILDGILVTLSGGRLRECPASS